ncbi:uncharacterized protein LOC107305604 isoform X2 [Oryza brachyantha]|uniref:uncharacterized protein LOC107305604 isoform X2 n=1 Tax=Oryza brachyantha TaxID=4533 RepID=UPI0007765A2E|nr:uncharacterized protein LOC107305604 isoform X2 [Oryza brachyantha]
MGTPSKLCVSFDASVPRSNQFALRAIKRLATGKYEEICVLVGVDRAYESMVSDDPVLTRVISSLRRNRTVWVQLKDLDHLQGWFNWSRDFQKMLMSSITHNVKVILHDEDIIQDMIIKEISDDKLHRSYLLFSNENITSTCKTFYLWTSNGLYYSGSSHDHCCHCCSIVL